MMEWLFVVYYAIAIPYLIWITWKVTRE